MTNTDKILEAVEYSYDDDTLWWEVFDSKKEAFKILSKAIKEEPEEHQIGSLLSCREEYIEDSFTATENYIYILKKLKRELREETE